MQNTEAELLSCQLIDSSVLAQREVQPNYLGLEERSVPQRKSSNAFFIFHFGTCLYCTVQFISTSSPPFFLMDTAYNYNTFESFYITLVPSEIVLAFILFSASVAQYFVKSDLSSFHMCVRD